MMTLSMFEPSVAAPVLVIKGDGHQMVTGFTQWWWRYVTGFSPTNHCQAALRGWSSRRVRRHMTLGPNVMNEHESPFFYLCGVSGRGWANNFHLALRPKEHGIVKAETYNHLKVTVLNVEQLEIPPLEDGFRGLPQSFTTCRNFQFAVAYLERAP